MQTYTYSVEGEPQIVVSVKAASPAAAAVAASDFAIRKRLMLIGPRELRHQPIYR